MEVPFNRPIYTEKSKEAVIEALLSYLKENGVGAVFPYIPLHSAPAGKKYGRFVGEDRYTTKESERLIRLPMYFGITEEETDYVIHKIKEFFR